MADWPKADPGLIERMGELLATYPAAPKKMFGTTSWFLDSNAQMFAGVWGDGMTVRVGKEEASRLIDAGEAAEFSPMRGRPMKEYVLISPERIQEDADLPAWVERAVKFAAGLPPKRK